MPPRRPTPETVPARPTVTLRTASPWVLSGLLAGSGVLHLAVPGMYDALVPDLLGDPRPWTLGSGVAELAVAAAVAVSRTRARGAVAAAVLFVAVFPGNVQMALDADTGLGRALAYGRLPLQVPLVLWALSVRRHAARAVARA